MIIVTNILAVNCTLFTPEYCDRSPWSASTARLLSVWEISLCHSVKFKCVPALIYKAFDVAKRYRRRGEIPLDRAEALMRASVNDGCIYIASGNDDIDVQVRVRCAVDKDGSIIVPMALLWRLLAKMSEEPLDFDCITPVGEPPRLQIASQSSHWEIYGRDGDDWGLTA